MLLEEFYNYKGKEDGLIVDEAYITTLKFWIMYNDFDIYESLIKTFEDREQYMICEGITRALAKVDDLMNNRFEEAEKLEETEEEAIYTHEEHVRVSRLIFEDILKEIYEKQASKYQKNN